jgi:hypothetical protein
MNKKISIEIELNTPNSQTLKPFDNSFDAVKYLLKHCTPEERVNLFSDYCKHCGSDDPKCQCWNDE